MIQQKMKIKGIIDTDFQNYKKPSLYIAFPHCSFKCGKQFCQNTNLAREKDKNIKISTIISIYEKNPVTKALVCGGLEPFDSWEDLQLLVEKFREYFLDDIVIYTGYTEDEIEDKIKWLSSYKNIIIKFGRYIPNDPPHLDKLLGVDLASLNQYAKSYNVMEDYC